MAACGFVLSDDSKGMLVLRGVKFEAVEVWVAEGADDEVVHGGRQVSG